MKGLIISIILMLGGGFGYLYHTDAKVFFITDCMVTDKYNYGTCSCTWNAMEHGFGRDRLAAALSGRYDPEVAAVGMMATQMCRVKYGNKTLN